MRRQPSKNQSSNERKSAGNSWQEQDDFFFGDSPNSSTNDTNHRPRSYAGICPPCPPPANSANSAASPGSRSETKNGKRNWSSKLVESSRNKIASLTNTASSHISDRINDLQQSQRRNQGSGTTKPSPGGYPGYPGTVASLPPALRRPRGTPPPSLSSSSSQPRRPPANPPSQRRQNISRMVQTALVSQIPLQCRICNSIPLMYQCHPFFGPSERICSTHSRDEITKCVSCFRFEPKHDKFARIGISDATVCPACARTALLDNAAATTLYWEILRFFSQIHGLDLFQGKMESIPVQLVDEPTLNSKSSSINCNPNSQKRGLCVWSESHYGLNIPNLPNLPSWMGGGRHSRNREDVSGGVPINRSVGIRHVTVKSIYCLKGLPRSLMGSILAHEAMHAWFGLNPLRRDGVVGEQNHGEIRRIPPVVEEGLCQLASHLYLNHVMDLESASASASISGGSGPSDDKLREYFRWSIETDNSPVYGDGFRMAAMAYNEICDNGGSLIDLLQYAMMHKALP